MEATMRGIELQIAIAERYERGSLPKRAKWSRRGDKDRKGNPLPNDFGWINGVHVRTLSTALGKLGFTQVARRRVQRSQKDRRRNIAYPTIWEAPSEWGATFQVQRRLRQTYRLTPAQIERATTTACAIADILTDAVDALIVDDIPLDKRGKLTGAVRKVIVDTYTELRYDSITRHEIAEWLGEPPSSNRQYLENRIRGLIRFMESRSR